MGKVVEVHMAPAVHAGTEGSGVVGVAHPYGGACHPSCGAAFVGACGGAYHPSCVEAWGHVACDVASAYRDAWGVPWAPEILDVLHMRKGEHMTKGLTLEHGRWQGHFPKMLHRSEVECHLWV